MKPLFVSITLLGLLAGSALSAPRAAQAAAPAWLIDKPGPYTLDHDIMVASGDAIMITASGVTLDLGGHNVGVATPGQGRGIVVLGAKGVRVSNGRVGPFGVDVLLDSSENVTVEGLQILGANLALLPTGKQNAGDPRASGSPPGAFAELGFLLANARASVVRNNTMTSLDIGIFNRGGGSSGCRFEGNTITGGPIAANNCIAACFNGLPTEADPGPTACVIEGNHIAGYQVGFGWQGAGTFGNITRDNTLAVWGDGNFYGANGDAIKRNTTHVNDTIVLTSP